MNEDFLNERISHAIAKVDRLMTEFPTDFPSASTSELNYSHKPNKEWTAGFFSGMVWLAFEVTGAEKYRIFGQKHTESFRKRLDQRVSVNFHDLGFLYSLSCVADYKLTGSRFAKETAVLAAELLATRFQEKGSFIQAWGDLDDPDEYRLIIDCFLNLPLLFWATDVTGNQKFAEIAEAHYQTAVKTVIRDDFTTFHTFFFDRENGEPLRGATNQGYADDSCWSRGQAWAIYGIQLMLKYRPTLFKAENQRFLNVLKKYHQLLGNDDLIPPWDFKAAEDQNLKDSSAAAIVVCGLQTYLSSMDREVTEADWIGKLKEQTLQQLMASYDSSELPQDEQVDGLLQHSMHHWPRRQGVDEAVLWGDYFYFEALVRESRQWRSYW